MVETYYAIRIGDPRRHKPYLWVGEEGRVPVLFATKTEAAEARAFFQRGDCANVVQVRIGFAPYVQQGEQQ